MPERLTRSLSFRLLAIFLGLAVSFVYFAIAAVRWVYNTDDLRELVRGHLSLHIEYVLNDIGDPPRIERAIAITRKVPVDIRISGPGVHWASDPAFPELQELSFSSSDILSNEADTWLGGLDGAQFATLHGHNFLRIGRGDYSIVVSTPKIADTATERQLMPIIVSIGLLLVLLAYLAVRWLFRPVADIRRGAALIGQGRFDHRIAGMREDQLGDLARDINAMAGDVQGMLDAKRQLLLGISHELRSPLSRIRLAVELLDDPAPRPTDVDGMREDISEMERIISTLLEAEHLNSRHATLHYRVCDLCLLVNELVDDYFARHRRRIRINCDSAERAVTVDEARVVLLLKNLLSNALRYGSNADGAIAVSIDVQAETFVVRVADDGPGFPLEQRESIGQPFFRGDPSRTRKTGGSGLGLYLATLVAIAHRGSLRLDDDYRNGACFEVRMPRRNR